MIETAQNSMRLAGYRVSTWWEKRIVQTAPHAYLIQKHAGFNSLVLIQFSRYLSLLSSWIIHFRWTLRMRRTAQVNSPISQMNITNRGLISNFLNLKIFNFWHHQTVCESVRVTLRRVSFQLQAFVNYFISSNFNHSWTLVIRISDSGHSEGTWPKWKRENCEL